jgi:hypothetical protein
MLREQYIVTIALFAIIIFFLTIFLYCAKILVIPNIFIVFIPMLTMLFGIAPFLGQKYYVKIYKILTDECDPEKYLA